MPRVHKLVAVALMGSLLWACSVQPQPFQDRMKFPSEPVRNEGYPGPRFMLVKVSLAEVISALDHRLKQEGFWLVERARNRLTYQIDDTGHDVVTKARVSFKFMRRGRELWIYTRARARISGVNVFDGTMTDVSRRKPARVRFKKLFRQVKSRLSGNDRV